MTFISHKLDCLFLSHAWLSWSFLWHYHCLLGAALQRLQLTSLQLTLGWITCLCKIHLGLTWILAYDIYARVSPHGYIWSNNLLSVSLVISIFNITLCTRSTEELAWGLLIYVNTGLLLRYFIKGLKSRLNPDPLSNTTLCGRRYLHIYVVFNRCITLEDYLSLY